MGRRRTHVCMYCNDPVSPETAIYGDLKDESIAGWICEKHIEDIVTIGHLSYRKKGVLHHSYMATKGELRSLSEDSEVSDIRILKAKINVDSIHDRWKPKKRSEAYRHSR